MREDNIFSTGGEISGDSIIGYDRYISEIKTALLRKLDSTGGIYIYGLPRMGKTSLIKNIAEEIEESSEEIIYLFVKIALYDSGNAEQDFVRVLKKIIRLLKKSLGKYDESITSEIMDSIEEFEQDDDGSFDFREDFLEIFERVKDAGLTVLLVLDEFDSASRVFPSKSEFEIFRSLTSEPDFSVCLVTVSRQQLHMIEHTNPANSTFKGVMYAINICGFDDNDIKDYSEKLKKWYDIELLDRNIANIKSYSGPSPYLWSYFGYEMVNLKKDGRLTNPIDIKKLYLETSLLTEFQGYYESVYNCLSRDVDEKGINYSDKLRAVIVGPSYIVTEEDLTHLKNLNYLTLANDKYITISTAFKKYLLDHGSDCDILNNFETLERKMKQVLRKEMPKLVAASKTTSTDYNQQWYDILNKTKKWNGTFDSSTYERQRKNTQKIFGTGLDATDVMSLSDAACIMKSYWNTFSKYFDCSAKGSEKQWHMKLEKCGEARNPIHHGTKNIVYSREEAEQINSYCSEIIRQLSD